MASVARACGGLERLHDWPQRLEFYMEQRKHMPFRWGSNDCCMFAAGAIFAITGIDIAAKFRGMYRTAHGASNIIQRQGSLFNLASQVTLQWGIQPISALLASRGDMVLVRGEQDALGIMSLSGDGAHYVTHWGLSMAPIKVCKFAWRI